MRIAVDVMGGDHGCGVVVEGARCALQADREIQSLHLVGDEAQIRRAMSSSHLRDRRVEVIHASEVLTMEDKPTTALRKKRDCSIARAIDLVRHGEADAVISLGNTGGIFAAAALRLGRLSGVDRGGIAAVIPTPSSRFVLLDSGANIECKPENLLQYAVMGNVYAREVLGCRSPRVGIISIGTEDTKGNELTLEAFRLCRNAPIHFVGNIEGHDLFEDRVDVVVCDGFVGNIVLKTCESLAMAMFSFMKTELTKSLKRQIGALLAQNAFRTIKNRMDPEVYGGAPLLGFKGLVMKAHGSARERAIMNAILVTKDAIQHHIAEMIADEVAEANRLTTLAGADVSTAMPA